MPCDTAEYRSVCISRDQQRRTNLHGTTAEFGAIPNGPTGVRDCICSTARTDENLRGQLLEKTDNIAKKILIHVRTDLPEIVVHMDQAATIPSEERKEEDKPVADPLQAYSTKKKSQKKRR